MSSNQTVAFATKICSGSFEEGGKTPAHMAGVGHDAMIKESESMNESTSQEQEESPRPDPIVVVVLGENEGKDGIVETSSECIKCRSQQTTTTTEKRVRWGDIDIYRHFMMIGDNPSVSEGLPVTLAWTAEYHEKIHIDDYERVKGQARGRHEMVLPRMRRDAIAKTAGLSRAEMRNTILAIRKEKHNRLRSARDGVLIRNLKKFWSRRSHNFVVSNTTCALKRLQIKQE